MKEEIIKYCKGLYNKEYVLEWVITQLDKLNKIKQTEFEHIIDYLNSDIAPKRLGRATYNQMKLNAEKWNKSLQKKGKLIKNEEVKTILDFKDGFKIVQLISKSAFQREGFLMRHCVGSFYGKDTKIYSLRDSKNMPHCTIEHDKQIKGKLNKEVSAKYINYIIKFLEFSGMKIRKNEMKNLGCKKVDFPSALKNKLIKKEYILSSEEEILKREYIKVYNKKDIDKYPKKKIILYSDFNNLEEYIEATKKVKFIKGNLYLNNLEKLQPNTQFNHNGDLYLRSLEKLPENTQFNHNGSLDLSGLEELPPNTQFNHNGDLDLRSLKELPPNTQFNHNGSLYLRSLEKLPKTIKIKKNIKVYLKNS